MILLIVISLAPYIWLIAGTSVPLRMPPIEVLVVTLGTCAIYHVAFLYACKRTGYSLLTVCCFFFWIFMGLAPLMCSITGRWAWGDLTFEMSSILVKAALLAFAFFCVMVGVYRFCFKRGWLLKPLLAGGKVTDARLVFGLWFSIGMSVIVFISLGEEGTFFRSGFDSYVASGPGMTFVQTFIRPIPLFIGVPMFWVLSGDKFGLGSPRAWLALMTVLIALTINFPLSVARFYAFMVVSVFIYYSLFHPALAKRVWLGGAFLLAGFMASFVVDAVRYVKTANEAAQSIMEAAASYDSSNFYVGHVDAFEMLVYGTNYVEAHGHTDGQQLLGVALFWIPREMWPNKPLPTGVYLGSSYINIMTSTENTNLSSPIILEGYLDAGLAGVIALSVLTGMGLGILDRALLERRQEVHKFGKARICRIDSIAAPFLGLLVYLLRGSLLATFAYTVAIVSAGLVVWEIFFRGKSAAGRPNIQVSL